METQWSHDDLFPIIAQTIEALHEQSHDFVTHDEIVNQLLTEAEAAEHIDAGLSGTEPQRSRDWVAHNMVAWFSQRITIGESDWAARFERKKVDGKWAYKPRT